MVTLSPCGLVSKLSWQPTCVPWATASWSALALRAKPRHLSLRGLNSVTTITPGPYEFIRFGGGGGQHPYESIRILTTTTTTQHYDFKGIWGGGSDRIQAADNIVENTN